MRRRNTIRNKVAIAGVGYSEIGRNTGKTEGELAVRATMAALEDAGLSVNDLDGIATFPDRVTGSAFEGPSISYMQRALGFKNVHYWQAMGLGAAQPSAIVGATYAVASGGADVVLCYRAHLRQERRFHAHTADVSRAVDELAFKSPFGVPAGAPRFALWAARYLHDYGRTAEDLYSVVQLARDHAQLNPMAVWYGHPITRDDYYNSPMIATPFRILDCDMPIDGAVAIIITTSERARSLRKQPVYIESIAHATGPSLDYDEWPDFAVAGSHYVAEQLWGGSELTPGDVDIANVYDGFSWATLCWLEDLGFCRPGEAGDFIRAGKASMGGELPVHTDGGQLGMGRLHGFGKIAETVKQLRGECGPRQVPGAKVGVAAAGAGIVGSAMLLTVEA